MTQTTSSASGSQMPFGLNELRADDGSRRRPISRNFVACLPAMSATADATSPSRLPNAVTHRHCFSQTLLSLADSDRSLKSCDSNVRPTPSQRPGLAHRASVHQGASGSQALLSDSDARSLSSTHRGSPASRRPPTPSAQCAQPPLDTRPQADHSRHGCLCAPRCQAERALTPDALTQCCSRLVRRRKAAAARRRAARLP